MPIEDYKEEIITRYLNGETAKAIAQDIPYHNSHISRKLHEWGVSRGRKSKKRLDNEKTVVEDFNNGLYCEDIAKKYNMDVHTVYRILDERNIKRQTGYHSNCDVTYFEKINNPHKAYLLGFITADGAVVNNCIAIEVHEKDRGVLEFAKSQINPQAKILEINYHQVQNADNGKTYEYDKHNVRIAFSAKKLGIDLAQYGVIQNKSKIIQSIPYDLIPKDLLPFYFRGLFDGDGTVLENGRIGIYSGSESFVENVQNILVKEAGVSKLKVYHGSAYFAMWDSKEDRQKLFDYLYSDLNATYYYSRKYERLKNSL